jgi:hypothetical protein
MLSVAGHSAGDLDGHPKVALGVEVGDVNPAELTAEDHVVLTLCLRDGLVEVRGGDGDARGALDRLTVLAVVVRVTGVDLSELLRADPVVVHLPPYRRFKVTHDDPELQRFVEDRLAH